MASLQSLMTILPKSQSVVKIVDNKSDNYAAN